jgi:Xaa-Pro dipeptidase
MRNFKPGMMEYQGESLFRHYCYYNYGCRLVGYTPICGCGPNAATLHYGHTGEPNDRQTTDTDIALFDMGAEYFGYSTFSNSLTGTSLPTHPFNSHVFSPP